MSRPLTLMVKIAAALSVAALGAAGIAGVAAVGAVAANLPTSVSVSVSTSLPDALIQGWIPGVGKPP
jgi:hypothetical protein